MSINDNIIQINLCAICPKLTVQNGGPHAVPNTCVNPVPSIHAPALLRVHVGRLGFSTPAVEPQIRASYLRAAVHAATSREKMADRGDLERFFQEADADGSGQLTLTELAVTLRKYGYTGTDQEVKVRV